MGACVVKNEPLEVGYQGSSIKLNGIIANATLYKYDTDNEDEACYLATIFNSFVLDGLIKPGSNQFNLKDNSVLGISIRSLLSFRYPNIIPITMFTGGCLSLVEELRRKFMKILPDILRRLGYDVKLKQRGYLMP